MNMKVIVTGGAGFIGSNFLKYMMRKHPENEYINIDKLTYSGLKSNVRDLECEDNYNLIESDISCSKTMSEIITEGSIIINFAAETHVDRSISDSQNFIKTNVLGTNNLLEKSRENNASLFIQISTDEVYGQLKEGEKAFIEKSNFNPSSPYSASKAAAEHLCNAYHKTYNLPVITLRCSNNYGPNQYPEKLVPLFTTNLLQDKKVPIYAEGKNIRDWMYVEDTCHAIEFIMEKGEMGQAYNVGSEKEIANIEITKKILELTNKDNSYIEYVEDRLGHDFRYALNTEKIKALGWKPKYSFDKAFKKTINWYIDNPNWWRPLVK